MARLVETCDPFRGGKVQACSFQSALKVGEGSRITDLGNSQDIRADIGDRPDHGVDAALRFRQLAGTILAFDIVLEIEPRDLDLGGRQKAAAMTRNTKIRQQV